MNSDFLTRLFASCSELPENGFVDGWNLSELYEHIEDTEQADTAFTAVVKSTGLSIERQNELEFACCSVSSAYERQGFINGFRLCARMWKELTQ